MISIRPSTQSYIVGCFCITAGLVALGIGGTPTFGIAACCIIALGILHVVLA